MVFIPFYTFAKPIQHTHCYSYWFIFLQADIKPKVDGCNGLRYDLTVDIIDSIFRTYPSGTDSYFMMHHASFLFSILPIVRTVLTCTVCI